MDTPLRITVDELKKEWNPEKTSRSSMFGSQKLGRNRTR